MVHLCGYLSVASGSELRRTPLCTHYREQLTSARSLDERQHDLRLLAQRAENRTLSGLCHFVSSPEGNVEDAWYEAEFDEYLELLEGME